MQSVAGAGQKQTFFIRVCFDLVEKGGITPREALANDNPGLAKIRSLVDIGIEVPDKLAVDRHISRAFVKRRRTDIPDSGPFGQAGHVRADIFPMPAVVPGYVHKPVIGAGPENALFHRRFRDRIERAAIESKQVIGAYPAGTLLVGLIIRGEIGADDRPGLAFICSYMHILAPDIYFVMIMARDVYPIYALPAADPITLIITTQPRSSGALDTA